MIALVHMHTNRKEIHMQTQYTTSEIARFQKYAPTDGDGCHEWTSQIDKKGYGRLRAQGTSKLAHRIAYELANGPIPAGMEVCHSCDNPRCVNPSHLFLGTHNDNMKDGVAKGRFSRTHQAKGEQRYNAKLTNDDVLAIRAAYASGEYQKDIAARYGMVQQSIHEIVTRKTWRHI